MPAGISHSVELSHSRPTLPQIERGNTTAVPVTKSSKDNMGRDNPEISGDSCHAIPVAV